MNAAFLEFADRFEPDELRESFDRSAGSSFLKKFASRKKYWDMYCDLYPILTEKGSSRFPQMYAEEFVRAYERQIAEYKRLGGLDTHLKETVVLQKNDVEDLDETTDDLDVTDPELAAIDVGELEAALANDDDVANG